MREVFHVIGETPMSDAYASSFYQSYGFAMVEWARIEDTLCDWFQIVTEMGPAMSRAVFFSAKNFAARSEMLASAMAESKLDPTFLQFLKDALDKGIAYNSTRNTLAHGVPRVNATDLDKMAFEWHEGRDDVSDNPMTVARIDVCAGNFTMLANILRTAHVRYRGNYLTRDTRSLEALHRQVMLLPNQADAHEPSRKQLGRLRQQAAKRPKKDEAK